MEDRLLELLESFGYPVMRQGSLGENPYPDTFLTFWERDGDDGSHYDNIRISVVYEYDVNVYSCDPDTAYSLMRQVVRTLKSEGFLIPGIGYDVASDEDSHIGRGVSVRYLNYEED